MDRVPMNANDIRRRLALATSENERLRKELEHAERSCCHQWGEVKYTPIYTAGFMTHGDPPGTMGVDRQLPMWIPPSNEKKWTRVCGVCGKTETTGRTKKKYVAGPIAGTGSEVEVPDFGDADGTWARSGNG